MTIGHTEALSHLTHFQDPKMVEISLLSNSGTFLILDLYDWTFICIFNSRVHSKLFSYYEKSGKGQNTIEKRQLKPKINVTLHYFDRRETRNLKVFYLKPSYFFNLLWCIFQHELLSNVLSFSWFLYKCIQIWFTAWSIQSCDWQMHNYNACIIFKCCLNLMWLLPCKCWQINLTPANQNQSKM